MDFVVGNPPYVRVHNLQESYALVKQLKTAQDGMTDLYIVFYELGLRMLNRTGTLSYIAPSSWFTSLAGRNLRNMLAADKHLVSVSDLGHYQPFPRITTYTAIVTIKNNITTDKVEYSKFNEDGKFNVVMNSWKDFVYEGSWYFGPIANIEVVKKVFSYVALTNRLRVKNGFATLADKTFLNTDGLPTDALTIPAIKSTTGEIQRIIYPYTLNGDLLSESDIKDDPVYTRLLPHKDQLEKNKPWYGYGRTQALRDVSREKITLNSTIKDRKTLRLNDAPAGYGVYGGLYIVGFESPTEKAAILDALDSDEFMNFVSMLKKYRRGGYYTFSSKDAQRYLEYRLGL
jgi:adenine-specific DNA-methyltransferase